MELVKGKPTEEVAPYFKVTVRGDDDYQLETNLWGDTWKWVVLKMAAEIRRGL
jgi:hypothetical protein